MNLYLAKLIFNITIEGKKGVQQFDEQTRIIQAQNPENAFFKAKVIGRKEEDTFVNATDEQVSWKFIDVSELHPLNDLKDGEQVYGHTHETEDAESFIDYIRQKSMEIQTELLTFA